MKLYYYYDKEADVFYFSQGKPSAKDESQETDDDVVIRVHPKTHRVRGFTLLNASRRTLNAEPHAVALPISLEFSTMPT